MKINIIAAVADNLALGNKGGLLWHISDDLKYFKRVTMGCPVIMGRKTFDSLGRPLPGRLNVVVTRNPSAVLPEGIIVAGSLEEAVRAASGKGSSVTAPHGDSFEADSAGERGDVFIIGGGEIYRQAMSLADKLYITHVHIVPEAADTYFPEIDPEIWELASCGETLHDPSSNLDYEFKTYIRKNG